MPLKIFEKLCALDKSHKVTNVKIISSNWGQIKGGKKGARHLIQKYDKQTIRKWRVKGGLASGGRNLKSFNPPSNIETDLAEFIGAYLGDGTLTKYFLKITGDKRYDEIYLKYLAGITEKTLGIKPTITKEAKRNRIYLEVRSKRLCDFLQQRFHLMPGDKIKNGSKIPSEITSNKELSIACLRGLVDTDGCVARDGSTFSIRFYSKNQILLEQTEKIGRKLGVFTFRSKNETGTRSWKHIKKYFQIAGSSNLRHIIRYREYLKGNAVKKKDILKYYKEYEKSVLPFMGS